MLLRVKQKMVIGVPAMRVSDSGLDSWNVNTGAGKKYCRRTSSPQPFSLLSLSHDNARHQVFVALSINSRVVLAHSIDIVVHKGA